jgi:GH25 family lysozyme M1 (1,4-beta-N-acetylmuramidase)
MTIFGLDVSRFQGSIDWAKVKAAGIDWATIKASEGPEWQTAPETRDYFRREFPRARAAGLTVGAYHVVRSGNIPEQVAWYLRQLTAVGANPLEIVNQLDFEKWDYDFPSYSTLKSLIRALLIVTPVKPVLYTGKWIWDLVSGDPSDAESDLGVPLWDSNYGTNPNVNFKTAYPGDGSSRWRSYGGWSASILQYGSKTIVPGVTGGCDANAYRGTLEEFRAQFIANEGDDVALAKTDVGVLAATDGYFDAPTVDPDGNPLTPDQVAAQPGGSAWMLKSHIKEQTERARVNGAAIKSLEDDLAAVKAIVTGLSTGGVDLDALAVKVADLLAQRLQS